MPTLTINLPRAACGLEIRVVTPGQDVEFVLPSDTTDADVKIGDSFIISNRNGGLVTLTPDVGVSITSPFGLQLKYLNDRVVIRKVESNLYEVIEFSGDPLLQRLLDTSIVAPSNGHVLMYNGSSWQNAIFNGSGPSISSTDQLPEGSTNLYFTQQRFTAALNAANLSDLGDVAQFTTPALNDILYFDGTLWNNIPVTQLIAGSVVTSVAGRTGAVVLSTNDVTEASNLYYTHDRFDTDFAASITNTPLFDLLDVGGPAPLIGTVLTWTGGEWRAAPPPTAPVTTVNGRVGDVILETGDINESTKLFYTTPRFNADFDTRFALQTLDDISDVSIALTVANDDLLVFDNGIWKNKDAGTVITGNATVANAITTSVQTQIALTNIADLNDVDFPAPVSFGDVLTWDGSVWTSQPGGLGGTPYVFNVNGFVGNVILSTTDIPEGTNQYWSQTRFDLAFDTAIHAAKLAQLSDVDTSAALNNFVLVYDSALLKWIAAAPPSAPVFSVNSKVGTVVLTTDDVQENQLAPPTNTYFTQARFDSAFSTKLLADLSNVAITSPIDGQYLVFSGGAWVNSSITQGASGVDQQVQYNNNGAFAGSPNFLWDDASRILTIGSLGIDSGTTVFSSNIVNIGAPNTTKSIRISNGTDQYYSSATIGTNITLRARPLSAGSAGDGSSVLLTATNAAATSPGSAFAGGNIIATIGKGAGDTANPLYASGFFEVASSSDSWFKIYADDGVMEFAGAPGNPGQVLTSNGTTGAPVWANPAPAAAGIDTQVQYNALGATTGSPKLTWTNAASTLQIGFGGPAVIKQADAGAFHNDLTVKAGEGGTFEGGILTLSGGDSATTATATGTAAGKVVLKGGDSTTNASAGDVEIVGGEVQTGTGAGGAVLISGGTSSGGVAGSVSISTGGGSGTPKITLSSSKYITFAVGGTTPKFTLNETGSWSLGANNANVGTVGQVLTSRGLTDTPEWRDVGSFAANGPDYSVQYAVGGALVGTGALSFDPTTSLMNIGAVGHATMIQATASTLTVKAGDGTGAAPLGKTLYLLGGDATSGAGGDVYVLGGANAGASGGNVYIKSADGVSVGNGANLTLATGGAGDGASSNGNMYFFFGGAGVDGYLIGARYSTGNLKIELFRVNTDGAWSFGTTGNAFGTAGQVLMSNGPNDTPYWNSAAAAALPSHSGHAGQFLQSDGTNAGWVPVTATTILPTQTGNSGKALITNGTDASWQDMLPTQTGQSGRYLQTNGTTTSWTAITTASVLPTQAGNTGKFLSTDGTTATWQSVNATGLAGGSTGTIPYQSSAGVTAFSTNFTFTGGTSTLLIGGTGGSSTISGNAGDNVSLSAANLIVKTGATTTTEQFRIRPDGSWSLGSTGTATGLVGQVLTNTGGSSPPVWKDASLFMTIALSDETSALTTGTAKVTFRAPFAMTLTQIPRSSLSTAGSGLTTVDIKAGGTSVLGTNKLSIDASEKTSVTAATATTLATTTIADDAEITIDITAAGAGALGLKVVLYYRRT